MQNKDIEVDISDEACKEYDLQHGDLVRIMYHSAEFFYATVIGVGLIPNVVDVVEKKSNYSNGHNRYYETESRSNKSKKSKKVLWLCPDGEINISKKIMYTEHKIKLITKAKDRG